MKWLHYRPFSVKFRNISDLKGNNFPGVCVCPKSEILDCRAVALEKERQFTFFRILKILEHPFLSEDFQNVSAVQSSGRL